MEYNIVERVARLERRIRELEEKIKGIDRINPSNTIEKIVEKKEDKEEESIQERTITRS